MSARERIAAWLEAAIANMADPFWPMTSEANRTALMRLVTERDEAIGEAARLGALLAAHAVGERPHDCGRLATSLRAQADDLAKRHPEAAQAIRDAVDEAEEDATHVVTKHWDEDTGDVVARTCSCGERWTYDRDDCPERTAR